MAAGRRNFQGPFGKILTLDVGKIRQMLLRSPGLPGRSGRQRSCAGQVIHEALHICHAIDGQALGKGRLQGVFQRHIQLLHPAFPGRQGHGQHTPYPADLALQAQLSQECAGVFGQAHTAIGSQNAQQNGQVVEGSGLFGSGRGQIQGNPADRKFEAAVLDGGPHPFPGFLHRSVRQTHHVKARQTVGDIAFHADLIALDAPEAQRADPAQHGRPSLLFCLSYYILWQKAILTVLFA